MVNVRFQERGIAIDVGQVADRIPDRDVVRLPFPVGALRWRRIFGQIYSLSGPDDEYPLSILGHAEILGVDGPNGRYERIPRLLNPVQASAQRALVRLKSTPLTFSMTK